VKMEIQSSAESTEDGSVTLAQSGLSQGWLGCHSALSLILPGPLSLQAKVHLLPLLPGPPLLYRAAVCSGRRHMGLTRSDSGWQLVLSPCLDPWTRGPGTRLSLTAGG
jgi:hypothetical protein